MNISRLVDMPLFMGTAHVDGCGRLNPPQNPGNKLPKPPIHDAYRQSAVRAL